MIRNALLPVTSELTRGFVISTPSTHEVSIELQLFSNDPLYYWFYPDHSSASANIVFSSDNKITIEGKLEYVNEALDNLKIK